MELGEAEAAASVAVPAGLECAQAARMAEAVRSKASRNRAKSFCRRQERKCEGCFVGFSWDGISKNILSPVVVEGKKWMLRIFYSTQQGFLRFIGGG